MKLDSVRSLKRELAEPPALPTAFARAVGARARSGSTLAARADRAHTRAAQATHMAMGVARGRSRGDFRLSVRIQARGARGRVLAEEVRARTRGEVDLRFTPHVVRRAAPPPSWFRRLRRPLEPGLSVGQGQDMAGTLGAIVEDTHAFYVLSNNHVLADVNRAGQSRVATRRPGPRHVEEHADRCSRPARHRRAFPDPRAGPGAGPHAVLAASPSQPRS